MRRLGFVGALVVGIFMGCAGSQVATRVIPNARAEGTFTRWQYACYADEPGPSFNEHGKEGWELIGWGGQSPVWCFKRPY